MFTNSGRVAAMFAAMFSGLSASGLPPISSGLRPDFWCPDPGYEAIRRRGKGRGNGSHSSYCVAMDRRAAEKRRNRLRHRAAVRKHS